MLGTRIKCELAFDVINESLSRKRLLSFPGAGLFQFRSNYELSNEVVLHPSHIGEVRILRVSFCMQSYGSFDYNLIANCMLLTMRVCEQFNSQSSNLKDVSSSNLF